MTKGPYIYDPAQKQFLRRGNSDSAPTPVQPAAAAAGLTPSSRAEGPPRTNARWYWLASLVLLALWLAMLALWRKQTMKYVPQGAPVLAVAAQSATNAAAVRP